MTDTAESYFEPQSPLDTRKNWLEARKTGIGGSEVSALFALNPYKAPIDLWLDKVGLAEPFDVSEPCEWGLVLEEAIRSAYERRTGWKVQRPVVDFEQLLQHPDVPTVIGSPDGLVPMANRGLEIKMCGFRTAEWGKAGTDEVPPRYLIQTATYMAVTGLPTWDLCCLFHGSQLEIYTIQRDREIEDQILNAVPDFWNKYVIPQIAPPVDASDSYKRYLGKSHKIGNQIMLPPVPEIDELGVDLRLTQTELKKLETHEQFVKNQLMGLIGENKGANLSDGDRVQWIRSKPSSQTDWEELAKSLTPTSEQIAAYTKEVQKSAYVRLYAGKRKP